MTTLADITLAAQQRCDRVNATTIVSQEWTSMVNASVAELWGLLVSLRQDFGVKISAFALTGGDPPNNQLQVGPGTAVPDFQVSRALWYQVAAAPGVRWVEVKPTNLKERNHFLGPSLNRYFGQYPAAWLLYGSTVEVLPPQSSAGNYQLLYVPTITLLVNPTDSVDSFWLGTNGWYEYVVTDVARKALIKEESLDTASLLAADCKRLRDRVVSEAMPRDDTEPGQIADTRAMHEDLGLGPTGWGSGVGGW